MNKNQALYFEKRKMEAESNLLSEEDVLQLYQDMADTGYAFYDMETSIHCRMLMMKGILKTPKNYNLIPVTPEEVLKLQETREKKPKVTQ